MSGEHHAIPVKVFVNVFLALIGLTLLTVVTAKMMDFGSFNVFVAFSIAAAKGFLVLAYFMHLKFDEKLFRWIIISSFGFVLLLFVICIGDIASRVLQQSTL